MIELLRLILHIIASLFKPRTKLVAEILILRQQLNVLRRQVSKRPQLRSYSGPRHCVWRGLQAAVACHGHSGQADRATIAVAEPVRRETDRHDPTGMSRPHDRIWGGTPAPDPGSVCRVL